ncbi:MAG: DUF302 domain-containing protein [Terriglobia bacterium]|jgi:uncharacterized protein (DUF302 family)
MLYKIESKKELAEVGRELEAAAQKHKFGVLAVHDLKAKMREKGVDYHGECLIYEVCNPYQAKKVLENNPELSTVLSCRISVYQTEKGHTLATLKPTSLVKLFEAESLHAVAEEVERTIVTIMQEAANPRNETPQLTH